MSGETYSVDHRVSADDAVHSSWDNGLEPIHPLTGPVGIEGARSGDVLEVELLELKHEEWGQTLIMPDAMELGSLADEFPEPDLYVWELEDSVPRFVDGLER
ncbi:acetamidase/formamidase family protein [Natronococcus sp. A-GB1]|uniref:acetamidase/formamidase family protein n=1 Tax=Natronococcus sp. A-GB1 TaxID=3037648 RepID=UPI0031F2E6FC